MPVQRYYSSVAQPTTLTGNISSGVTTIGVASPTGFPTSYPFTVTVDYATATEELMDVTDASLGIWTVTRGVDGTSAQSHSIGAAVRHVSSGRDFAEAQAHAAATGAVHGVAGTLVGTSDVQTLANKTMTSPTVNSGALSGTFTGSPTFSGAPTFSGGGALSGTFSGAPNFSGVPVFSGGILLSSASALAERAAVTDNAYRARVAGDTNSRWLVDADGKQIWGTGSATGDTTLYRSGAGVLKTDGTIQATNLPPAWTSGWKPAWGTSTGLHLPSYGNAVTAGAYMKINRLLTFSFSVTFGSGTTFGGGTTNDNWTLSLPNSYAATATFAGTDLICGFGRATQAAGATIPFSVRVDSGGTNFVMDTAGGRQDGVSITNTGLLDAVSPWAWASGNTLQFWGSVETTA